MLLPLSTPHTARLEALAECGSTNSVMVAHAADGWPDFSAVVTSSQTAGRGRLGRVWSAPPGQTLAVSVLLRPGFAIDAFGWLPLMAGVAMARAVRAVLPGATAGRPTVALKWPNDVLVDDLKVSGLLAELVSADAVVLGAGLNLTIPADALPTPAATSLVLHGANPDDLLDRALSVYLRELAELYGALRRHGGDAQAAGIRDIVRAECATIGRTVNVELPSEKKFVAEALDVDGSGRLVVKSMADGVEQAVAAGDVTHVRYE